MNAKEMFLEALKAGKDIKEARRACGAPTYACVIWARDAGLALPGTIEKIASRNQQVGMHGEKLFQELVPKALNMNTGVKRNCKDYDFYYRGISIDIKTASETTSGFHYCHLRDNCDLYCLFALNKKGEIEHIALLPGAMFAKDSEKTMVVTKSRWSQRFGEFEVKPDELNAKLDMIVDGA